jgi:hypothetical protein
MPRRLARMIPATVFGIVFQALLAAETGPGGRFSVTPWIGAVQSARLGRLIPLPRTADVPDVSVQWEPQSPEVGLTIGYRLSRRLEVQAGASAGRTALFEDIGIGLAGIPLGRVKVSNAVSWTLGMRLLCGFGKGRFRPYLSAGFGVAGLDAGELGSRTRPAVDAGAGLIFRPPGHFQFVLDFRDNVSFFRYFEDLRIAYVMVYTTGTEAVQHRLSARAGLGYVF